MTCLVQIIVLHLIYYIFYKKSRKEGDKDNIFWWLMYFFAGISDIDVFFCILTGCLCESDKCSTKWFILQFFLHFFFPIDIWPASRLGGFKSTIAKFRRASVCEFEVPTGCMYLVVMSLSWNFPSWAEPSWEGCEPSRAWASQFSSWNWADFIDINKKQIFKTK